MLEKTKSFVKDHKRGIVLTGCVVAGVITGVVLCKRFDKEMVDLGKQFCGKSVISWTETNNGFIDLERVKEILDANANNSAQFAIFREGPDPNAYIGILLSDDVII